MKASSSRSVTPAPPLSPEVYTATVGEQLQTDYGVHELPGSSTPQTSSNESLLVNHALLAHIEILEAENTHLKTQLQQGDQKHFRIESIQHDDKLVSFYTGFISYAVFLAFFEFLGPVVNHLNYCGSKEGVRERRHIRKLDSKNHLLHLSN